MHISPTAAVPSQKGIPRNVSPSGRVVCNDPMPYGKPRLHFGKRGGKITVHDGVSASILKMLANDEQRRKAGRWYSGRRA